MYLIDTHVLLWSLYDSNQLSNPVRGKLNQSECCVSIASLWEIAIKSCIGKLELKQSIQDIADICEKHGIKVIGITPCDCDEMKMLPRIHNDPFDRIIIAQAKTKNCTIITKDRFIPQYDVKTFWI